MKKQIESIIKKAISEHLIQHKHVNDARCRIDILADEASNEIIATFMIRPRPVTDEERSFVNKKLNPKV